MLGEERDYPLGIKWREGLSSSLISSVTQSENWLR
ncbi:hypothetical protein RRG08_047102, partial [Elysia crispata]